MPSIVLLIGLCTALLALMPDHAQGQVRRALLIGINKYRPTQFAKAANSPSSSVADRGWVDLDGAVNDVSAMEEILVARFGFARNQIRVLTDSAASRDAILHAFREHLLVPAKEGDVCVFFFSGHGSQMRNSKCPEPDCKDETIVPADANHGAPDIRDKEWLRLFNDVLDRGAILTVFFDSCHSGSLSRGLGLPGKSRFLKPDPRDAAKLFATDFEDPRGAPTERGALVFSAAQDFQLAFEAQDGQGVPHGAFSLALVKTLRTVPTGEPAEDVYRRVRALVQSEGSAQEPVREGTPARLSGPLFGRRVGSEPSMRVALESVSEDGQCILQGGLALGLCTGCELRKVGDTQSGKPARIRVVSTEELNRCTARVVEGAATDLEAGDLFELDRWSGCDEPFLRVWVPPATLSYADLLERSLDLEPLRTEPGIHWVEDPSDEPPTHVLAWNGSDWQLLDVAGGMARSLGKTPNPTVVIENLRNAAADTVRFFHYLPVPSELAARFDFAPQNPKHPIEETPSLASAHYGLVGRRQGGALQYAWLLPNVSQSVETSCPLPARSDWCEIQDNKPNLDATARLLEELARRMGRIRMWLQLDAPPDEGLFPYRLTFVKPTTEEIQERPMVYSGESFQLALRAGPLGQAYVQRRYVYVFAIDGHGQMTLLFPLRSNEGNRLPTASASGSSDSLIVLGRSVVTVTEPYGIDTYFLLTTREPLPDLNVLRSHPVRDRGESDRSEGPRDPLSRILTDITAGRRGMHTSTPVDWSVQRFSVRSAPNRR